MSDVDPMLDGITAYTMDVECMNYCYGGSPRLEEDKYPDDNCVVMFSDLPALLARVREDERRTLTGGERHREWWVAFGMGKAQGQRDEREKWEPMVQALTDELLAKAQPDVSMGAQYLAGVEQGQRDEREANDAEWQRTRETIYQQGYSAAMDDGWGEPGHIKAAIEAERERIRTGVTGLAWWPRFASIQREVILAVIDGGES